MAIPKGSTTIRQRLGYRPRCSGWFATTCALYNAVVEHYVAVLQAYPDVLDLSAKEALTALERLTHATKANPSPVMPLSAVSDQIPAVFRRAAIHTALGIIQAFQSHLARWRNAKAKAEARGKPFHQRPPVLPRSYHRSVTLYAGMWQRRTEMSIVLKLYDGQTWRWVRFDLSERQIPKDWETASPQLVERKGQWYLHTPLTREMERPPKAKIQVQTNPDVRICAIDLNLNDALAVATILTADGTVLASTFVRGGDKLHDHRRRLLGQVARNRRATRIIEAGVQDNKALWEKIRHLDEDAAHRVSRRLVDFAQIHGASILVFEHLAQFRPQKGKYSTRGNEKRSYWLRGKIVTMTRYKAWNAGGLLTCRVNPRDTSRRCAWCGSLVARHDEAKPASGYTPGAPLFQCTNELCGKRGNADWQASVHIGRRLLARYAT